jgi:mannose-1-phosphate guanylyltransferase
MLEWTIERAADLVSVDRIVPVVAAQHRHWWEADLPRIPADNVAIQPDNRGTAAGILLPLLKILRRDPLARVLILPSDHYVRDEGRLRNAIVQALHAVHVDRSRTGLIGMPPRESDTEYGWILPATPTGEVSHVDAFVEKPNRKTARSLMRRGAVLNSFIIVAEGVALLQQYLRTVPRLVGEFVAWKEDTNDSEHELAALYRKLPISDFSRDVLERSAEDLLVVRASECGWTDLGTPKRLKRHQGKSRLRRTDDPGDEERAAGP